MATSESRFYYIPIAFPSLDRLDLAGAHLALYVLQSHQKLPMPSDSAHKLVAISRDIVEITLRRHLSRSSTEYPASSVPHHHLVDGVHLSLTRSTNKRTPPHIYKLAIHTGCAHFQYLPIRYPAFHCKRSHSFQL